MFECGHARFPVGCVTVDEGDVVALGVEIGSCIVAGCVLDIGDGDICAAFRKASSCRKANAGCTTFDVSDHPSEA